MIFTGAHSCSLLQLLQQLQALNAPLFSLQFDAYRNAFILLPAAHNLKATVFSPRRLISMGLRRACLLLICVLIVSLHNEQFIPLSVSAVKKLHSIRGSF
jgi:hypothetical protein